MEILDIYTENGEPTGRTIERGVRRQDGDYILVVHLCIFNSKGEMLIQQRNLDRDNWGGKWDLSAGGHVASGESGLEAIYRESAEEIGVELPENVLDYRYDFTSSTGNGAASDIDFRFSVRVPLPSVLSDIYTCRLDIEDLAALELQKEEVNAVNWVSLETLLHMIDTQEFVLYDKELIRSLWPDPVKA